MNWSSSQSSLCEHFGQSEQKELLPSKIVSCKCNDITGLPDLCHLSFRRTCMNASQLASPFLTPGMRKSKGSLPPLPGLAFSKTKEQSNCKPTGPSAETIKDAGGAKNCSKHRENRLKIYRKEPGNSRDIGNYRDSSEEIHQKEQKKNKVWSKDMPFFM